MQRHQELRHFYRYEIRKEDISRERADARNLMICLASSHEKQCSICVNQWILVEAKEKIISLLIEVFNKQQVCTKHAQYLFSKILQILLELPQYFYHFIHKQPIQSISTYSRKVILLFEIVENELLMNNSEIQQKLLFIFEERDQFTYRLMDTALGLNDMCFQEEQTLNGFCDARRISYNTVLYIFERYPLLFQNLFQQYPLIEIIQRSNHQKLLHLYQLFRNIYTESLQKPTSYQNILPHLEEGIRSQISSIKTLQQPFQLQRSLFSLIKAMLKSMRILHVQTVKEIIQYCLSRLSRFAEDSAKIMSVIYDFYEERLNEEEKQYIEADILKFSEACSSRRPLDSTMDVQIS